MSIVGLILGVAGVPEEFRMFRKTLRVGSVRSFYDLNLLGTCQKCFQRNVDLVRSRLCTYSWTEAARCGWSRRSILVRHKAARERMISALLPMWANAVDTE